MIGEIEDRYKVTRHESRRPPLYFKVFCIYMTLVADPFATEELRSYRSWLKL